MPWEMGQARCDSRATYFWRIATGLKIGRGGGEGGEEVRAERQEGALVKRAAHSAHRSHHGVPTFGSL